MAKVVIIDQNEIVIDLYRRRLESEGHIVQSAMDGQVGFDLVHSLRPHLILLDLIVPTISGLELIKRLREEREFKEIPIIAFSQSDSTDQVEQAKEAGATLVYSKANNSPKKIIEKIKELLAELPTAELHSSTSSLANSSSYSEDVDRSNHAGRSLGRVLVVEDDPLIMMMVADVIEKEGYTVVTAQDGREAYKIMERDANFVAGIFDVIMPYIQGPDLVRHMRTERRLMNIPVIMISADQSIKVQFESFDAGAVLFIRKPFKRTKLKNLFHMLVTKSEATVAAGGEE
jgi:CheY-like chemotaxis protein